VKYQAAARRLNLLLNLTLLGLLGADVARLSLRHRQFLDRGNIANLLRQGSMIAIWRSARPSSSSPAASTFPSAPWSAFLQSWRRYCSADMPVWLADGRDAGLRRRIGCSTPSASCSWACRLSS
jgi:hypothetical protein